MAKHKNPEPKTQNIEEKTTQLAVETKIEYAFPTKSRCPRCQSTDTRAVSTQGKYQYRECTRAICRHRYTVIGVHI